MKLKEVFRWLFRHRGMIDFRRTDDGVEQVEVAVPNPKGGAPIEASEWVRSMDAAPGAAVRAIEKIRRKANLE